MIAGAGSGKTTVMAARVVYLVVTGQVRPDQVLGLTFTTKAAARAADPDPRGAGDRRVRPRAPLGRGRGRGGRSSRSSRPTTPTPPALLVEHGLRIGHEPDTRVITDAARYQLAARVIDRHDGPVRLLSDSPPPRHRLPARARRRAEPSTSSTPAGLRGVRRPRGRGCSPPSWPHRQGRATRRRPARVDRRAELLSLVEELPRASSAHLGLMDFSDQIALAAELADRHARRRASWSGSKFRVVLLDEYQDTSVAQALMLAPAVLRARRRARARAPGHRGRRPQPGDLRLAGRLGVQHPRASATTFPGRRRRRRRDVPAHRQPPLRPRASSSSPTALARPLYDAVRAGAPARAEPDAADRARCRRSCTRRTPTSWRGWSTQVRRAHDDSGGPTASAGARSAC